MCHIQRGFICIRQSPLSDAGHKCCLDDMHETGDSPADTHTHTCINTYIFIYVHPFIPADTRVTSKTPDTVSSQATTANQLQVCLGLIHMLCYYRELDKAWENIKHISHMQILTDGMTGWPSQSFRYVYRSLVRRLCDYSALCATEGQRNNSFDMRYVFVWRQWLLTEHAIMCVCWICSGCSAVASGPWMFDVCISPAVMNVAAAGWVSGELIISVCHLWWGWSCDTGNNYTAFLVWCGRLKRLRVCLCEDFTWSASHTTETRRGAAVAS